MNILQRDAVVLHSSIAMCRVVGWCLLASCSLAWGLPARGQDFTLSYKVESPKVDEINEARYRRFFASPLVPASLKKKPNFRSKQPLFISLHIGTSSWLGAFDESRGSGKSYDLLYIDSNRNGNLADERPYSKPTQQMGMSAQVVRVKAPPGMGQASYDLHVAWWADNRWQKGVTPRENWQGLASNVGVWTGPIKLGERAMSARLIDFDNDGFYGTGDKTVESASDAKPAASKDAKAGGKVATGRKATPSNAMPPGAQQLIKNYINVDWDNDGKFDALEILPLGKRLLLDGIFYGLQAAPDGKRVSFQGQELNRAQDLKFGTLACDVERFSLIVTSSDGFWTLAGFPQKESGQQTIKEAIKVPVGTYAVDTWIASTTGTDKKQWHILGGSKLKSAKNDLSIEENKNAFLNLVTPLINHLRIERNKFNGDVYFNQVVRDGKGSPVALLPEGKTVDFLNPTQLPRAPSVLVTDEKGKKVAQLTSAVSHGYQGVFHWAKFPSKGKYRARLVFGENPLNIQAAPEISFDAASIPTSQF